MFFFLHLKGRYLSIVLKKSLQSKRPNNRVGKLMIVTVLKIWRKVDPGNI